MWPWLPSSPLVPPLVLFSLVLFARSPVMSSGWSSGRSRGSLFASRWAPSATCLARLVGVARDAKPCKARQMSYKYKLKSKPWYYFPKLNSNRMQPGNPF